MAKATIRAGKRKPVFIYKNKCPYCRTKYPTGKKNRVTCGKAECRYKHSLAYKNEYNYTPAGRGQIREYMRNRYYGLIMLRELEKLANLHK